MKIMDNAILQYNKKLFPTNLIFAILIILSIMSAYHLAVARPATGSSGLNINFKLSNSNPVSCNCVAFRLDDVQDDYLTKPQIGVMNVFKERNLSLTVGVIGHDTGKGEKLVSSYMKERIVNGSNKTAKDAIEIANHSWDHEHFQTLTIDEQSDSIRKTNEKIKNIFGISPTIFIAPYSEFNNDTILALRENNMSYFSADLRDHGPYLAHSNATIYHVPETAETGGCTNCKNDYSNASWYGVSHNKTLSQINGSLSKYGFAVVLMHPDEYSIGHEQYNPQNDIDRKQIRELELLIDKIQEEGISIVTIGDMINHFKIS
jgi:peptidoglycan/xylan/chitin deacetylase (PgdA/CDA1 family)